MSEVSEDFKKDESWQAKYIRTNLPRLLQLTSCNTQLIAELTSQNVLFDEEANKLETLQKNSGGWSDRDYLYKTIQTRKNGYEKLAKALYECNQSGAYLVLFKGFQEIGILESNVLFQGREDKLKNIFKDLKAKDFKELIEKHECKPDYFDIFTTMTNKNFVLLEDTIPQPPPFYIPRLISNRFKVNPAIFKQDCEDVFIFKGMDRCDITKLAHPNPTSTSIKLLFRQTTSRFIFLEDDCDWEELCKISKVPTHLIKRDKDKSATVYIWEGASGVSKILPHFIEEHRPDEKSFLPEDDFLDKVENEDCASGVCICDKLGMGKTHFIANLARTVRQRHPDKIVIFISLSNFTRYLMKKAKNFTLSDFTAEYLVLDHVSRSNLAKAILLKAVEIGIAKMELFFDGLDEISNHDDHKTIMNVLKKLSLNRRSIKLYVTSRPELRIDLETTLGVIAFDILPFTRENQEIFFVNFWTKKINNKKISEPKLTLFASKLIQNIRASVNQQGRDLMGIPLQCRLLAEVYCDEAQIFSNPLRNLKFPKFRTTSVFEMYQNFVNMRFSSYDNANIIERADIKTMSKSEKEQVKTFHIWLALKLLFPEIAEDYAQLMTVNKEIPVSTYLSFGILEYSGSDSVSFVHRTLAEFLVATFFANILCSNQQFCLKKSHLVEKIITFSSTKVISLGRTHRDYKTKINGDRLKDLSTFKYPVIVNFLDGLFNSSNSNLIGKLANDHLFTILTPIRLYEILESCAPYNYVNIVRFMLKSASKATNFQSYAEFMMTNYVFSVYKFLGTFGQSILEKPVKLLLLTLSQFSNDHMMKEFFELFLECFHIDLTQLCQTWDDRSPTPLEFAVNKIDYEMVEYLLEKFSYEPKHLIGHLIENSYNDSGEVVTRKLQICQLILSHIESLSEENALKEIMKDSNVLEIKKAHLELIKFLIQERSDPFQVIGEKKTIVHQAAEFMSANDLNDLYRFLIFDCKAAALFQQNKLKWDSPIHYILRKANSVQVDTLEMLLDSTGTNVNEIDDDFYGDNLILAAAWGGQSVDIMKMLVGCGADYKLKVKEGKTVLHFAAWRGNVEVAGYFLSLGLSLEECDEDGNTPILGAHKQVNMIKHLVNKGANFCAKNKRGSTIAHKAAMWMNAEDFHEFVAFTSQISKATVLFSTQNQEGHTPLEMRRLFKMETLPETIEQLSSCTSSATNKSTKQCLLS